MKYRVWVKGETPKVSLKRGAGRGRGTVRGTGRGRGRGRIPKGKAKANKEVENEVKKELDAESGKSDCSVTLDKLTEEEIEKADYADYLDTDFESQFDENLFIIEDERKRHKKSSSSQLQKTKSGRLSRPPKEPKKFTEGSEFIKKKEKERKKVEAKKETNHAKPSRKWTEAYQKGEDAVTEPEKKAVKLPPAKKAQKKENKLNQRKNEDETKVEVTAEVHQAAESTKYLTEKMEDADDEMEDEGNERNDDERGNHEDDQDGKDGEDQDGEPGDDKDREQEDDQGGKDGEDQDGEPGEEKDGEHEDDQGGKDGEDQEAEPGEKKDDDSREEKDGEEGPEKDGERGEEKDGEEGQEKDGERGEEKDGEEGQENDGEHGDEKDSEQGGNGEDVHDKYDRTVTEHGEKRKSTGEQHSPVKKPKQREETAGASEVSVSNDSQIYALDEKIGRLEEKVRLKKEIVSSLQEFDSIKCGGVKAKYDEIDLAIRARAEFVSPYCVFTFSSMKMLLNHIDLFHHREASNIKPAPVEKASGLIESYVNFQVERHRPKKTISILPFLKAGDAKTSDENKNKQEEATDGKTEDEQNQATDGKPEEDENQAKDGKTEEDKNQSANKEDEKIKYALVSHGAQEIPAVVVKEMGVEYQIRFMNNTAGHWMESPCVYNIGKKEVVKFLKPIHKRITGKRQNIIDFE